MAQIFVFGDSITYGAWDKEGGWVQRLRKFLDEKTSPEKEDYFLVYNLGVDSDTTEDVLRRFKFETEQRLEKEEETLIIFSVGINDSLFVHSQNGLYVPQEKFKENTQKLIELAQKFSSKIIFVGLTPVDESKTTPVPWDKDISYKNEYIKVFNGIIKSVCEKDDILFIEIFEDWLKLDYKNLLEDGLHPNSEGHKKVFEIVRDFIIENKIV